MRPEQSRPGSWRRPEPGPRALQWPERGGRRLDKRRGERESSHNSRNSSAEPERKRKRCDIVTCNTFVIGVLQLGQFGTFQEAVHQLLSDIRPDGQEGAPGDYDLIAQLEQLVAEHKELRDTVKCLGSSLQQLEQGFRSGYSDTLAILHTKA